MPAALIVEASADSSRRLANWLESRGVTATAAASVVEAREALEEQRFDLVLVDLTLPDGSGLDLLSEVEDEPDTEVVLMAENATAESAIEAFRGGAVDLLVKPVDTTRLERIVARIARAAEFRGEIHQLREELRLLGRFGSMIGASPAMQEVYGLILKVAPTSAPVLVTGETGTGKELVAETVHGLSARAKRPFVPVNCGAISESLIESELFGHERGAFTGADRRHEGFFERARGGTLFLDEITEMPIELQVKLLRALETQQIRRVGGREVIPVDVRVVAATNRDPKQAVEDGSLREDLLYRLLVFPIELPPLRERDDDVLVLADHFLSVLNRNNDTQKRFTDEAREQIADHDWPGNVRELKHAVEGAYIRAGTLVRARDLPFEPERVADLEGFVPPVGATIAQVEKALILATLEQLDGSKKDAAKTLGISVKTLYNRLNQYAEEEDED